MRLGIDALFDRILASLAGAVAAEAEVGSAAGARQLLDLAELLAAEDDLDIDRARARHLGEAPPTGKAGLLLRAVPVALLSPLDRPRLRRTTHLVARLGGADEGTALVAVATACLAADLCRFDLATALTRVHQTMLEEAPIALLARLRPLREPVHPATGDPGDALQLALTALEAADDLPGVIAEAVGYPGESVAAAVLAASLAGIRSGLAGIDEAWWSSVPARSRIETVATALAERAVARLPTSGTGELPERGDGEVP